MVLRRPSTCITQQTQVAVGVALRPSVPQRSASAAAPAPAAAAAPAATPVVATKQVTTSTAVHQQRAAAVGKPVGLRNLQVCSPKLAVLIQGTAHNPTVDSSQLPAGIPCATGTSNAKGISRPWGNGRCRGKHRARRAQSCNFPRSSCSLV